VKRSTPDSSRTNTRARRRLPPLHKTVFSKTSKMAKQVGKGRTLECGEIERWLSRVAVGPRSPG
jgi:hypothetical protein